MSGKVDPFIFGFYLNVGESVLYAFGGLFYNSDWKVFESYDYKLIML